MNARNAMMVALLMGGVSMGVWGAQVDVAYDHKDGNYAVGETATFTVTVKDDKGEKLTNGVVTAELDNYGTRILSTKKYDLAKGNPFAVTGALAQPGYLRLKLAAPKIKDFPHTQYNDTWYFESVAFSPEKIVPPVEMPVDFERFWREAIAKYDREITTEPVLTLEASLTNAEWNVWRLTLDVPHGRKLHCWVTREKAAKGRLPARVQISAAGFGNWSQWPKYEKGHVAMFVTVYPFAPEKDLSKKKDYDALGEAVKKQWGVPRYCFAGITGEREDMFFYPVILGALRAIDWLAARDDVDPNRVTYTGTSQGGGLGLAVTALSSRFRKSAIFVPALTGHYGYLDGCQAGWPDFWSVAVGMANFESRVAAAHNAAYYDGVNFARLVKIPVRIVAGCSDNACSPTMVRSAYNVVPSKDKEFRAGLKMPHGVFRELYVRNEKWLDE